MKESYEERWMEIKKNSKCHVHAHHKLRVSYMYAHGKGRCIGQLTSYVCPG